MYSSRSWLEKLFYIFKAILLTAKEFCGCKSIFLKNFSKQVEMAHFLIVLSKKVRACDAGSFFISNIKGFNAPVQM